MLRRVLPLAERTVRDAGRAVKVGQRSHLARSALVDGRPRAGRAVVVAESAERVLQVDGVRVVADWGWKNINFGIFL